MTERYGYYYFLANILLFIFIFATYFIRVNLDFFIKFYITIFVLITFIYIVKKPPKFIIILKGLKNDFRLDYRKTDSNRESDRI